ncbi:hypothetical protein BASA81_004804 [Batrachochytrium salamandrivorans]|nr:hypothetical protein BASA81_004804 [Batrachochytrium salamandrivorans]
MKKAPRLSPRRSTRFVIYVVLALVGAGLFGFLAWEFIPKQLAPTVNKPLPAVDPKPVAVIDPASPAKAKDAKEDDEEEATSGDFSQTLLAPDAVKSGKMAVESTDPMSRFIIGYPTTPLSLQELKLCDELQTIILHGSYRCPQDNSCLACVKPSQAVRFRDLHGAYRHADVEPLRNQKILQDFAGQKTIVLFTFNYAHSDLFLNWACSADKLGLEVKKFTLVIACDEKTQQLVSAMGFKFLDPTWQTKLAKPIHEKESYWGQDHADINNLALFAMNDLTALGFQVFVHDADIAWLQNPFPFFESAIQRRDFIGMLAPFWTSMGPVNTGLLFLAPTLQTKVFLKSMENAAIVKGTSDQKLWNAILRHFSFQQLEWRLLPQEVVYKYSGRGATPPNQHTLLMHAVGSGKREKLARFKLWLLHPSCPFYNKQADEMNAKERTSNNSSKS